MTSIFELVPETHHALLDAAWAAALVTLDSTHRPQTTAVWYLADRETGELQISLSDARVKFRHLQGNPEIDFFLVDPANQFHTLEIRGTASIGDDDGLAAKVSAKYDSDVTGFDQPGDVRHAVTITPRRVLAH